MKKAALLLLIFALVLGLCGCTVKIEPININDIEGTDPEDDPESEPVVFEDMTMAEKFEYLAGDEHPLASLQDDGTIAPAQDTATKTWGYINKLGEWVISPVYAGGYIYTEEIAPVLDDYLDYKYITREGKTIFNTVKRKAIKDLSHFSQGLAVVKLDVSTQQKYVYVNTLGEITIKATKLNKTTGVKYESSDYFDLATEFRNGLAVCSKLLNSNSTKTTAAMIIDTEGKYIRSLPEGLDFDARGFDENMLLVVHNTDGLYGLCNEYGILVANCRYTWIEHCEGEYYAACDENGYWGFLNSEGNIVISFKYESALPFSENIAAVKYDGLWGFISTDGQWIIEPVFDEVEAMKQNDPDTDVGMGAFSSGVAVVKIGECWGVIDSKCNIVASFQVSECPVLNISGGLITYMEGDLAGLMDTRGYVVVEPAFLNIGSFS